MGLCTLDDVKAYMDIDVTRMDPSQDDLVTSLITRMSTQIDNYCDRTFASTEYTEYYNGGGLSYLYTDNYPIISVSSINDDSTWEWGSSTLIDSDDYRISNSARQILLNDTHFGNYTENVKIVYTAGYSTIPYDLVKVCIVEVVSEFKRRKDPHVASKSVGDGTLTRYETGFLPSTITILDKYKNKGIV